VAGLFFGFAFGLGGIGAALLGSGRRHGVQYVFKLCSSCPSSVCSRRSCRRARRRAARLRPVGYTARRTSDPRTIYIYVNRFRLRAQRYPLRAAIPRVRRRHSCRRPATSRSAASPQLRHNWRSARFGCFAGAGGISGTDASCASHATSRPDEFVCNEVAARPRQLAASRR
jgi:hypothetical protein